MNKEFFNKEEIKKFIKKNRAILKERNEARKEKNFKRADEIRDELAAMNIEILDSKEGSTWKVK